MTVYFISDGRGAIKIGYTDSSVYDRLDMLQIGNASELTLLGTIDGGPEVEKELHARFSSQRIRGEWFATTLELLRLIPEQPKKEFVVQLPENDASGAGAMIRNWRETKGVSQQTLAAMVGISQPLLSAFEVGKRCLSIETAVRMREVVGPWFSIESCLMASKAHAVRSLTGEVSA